MSVESEILRIQHNIADAYAAVSGKGGEVPLQPTSANLAAAIGTISGSGSSGGVPIGTIVIWSGTAGNIPSGWALCDGQDGRPDLRDKFVLGAGTAHAVGDTGGEETHKLAISELPPHSHNVIANGSSNTKRDHLNVDVVSTAGWKSVYSTETGSGHPHNNMPPYYALCYIIKTTEDNGGGSTSGGGGGNPIGTVISFLGTSAPAGYLACDGAVYNISEYAALAALFQTQFGSSSYFGGNGSTTFAVPDMRNLFLRGYHGSTTALSGGIGKKQAATEIPGFATFYNPSDGWSGIFSGASHKEPGISTFNIDGADTQTSVKSALYTGVSENGVEEKIASTYTARPVNMAVLYCIKAS